MTRIHDPTGRVGFSHNAPAPGTNVCRDNRHATSARMIASRPAALNTPRAGVHTPSTWEMLEFHYRPLPGQATEEKKWMWTNWVCKKTGKRLSGRPTFTKTPTMPRPSSTESCTTDLNSTSVSDRCSSSGPNIEPQNPPSVTFRAPTRGTARPIFDNVSRPAFKHPSIKPPFVAAPRASRHDDRAIVKGGGASHPTNSRGSVTGTALLLPEVPRHPRIARREHERRVNQIIDAAPNPAHLKPRINRQHNRYGMRRFQDRPDAAMAVSVKSGDEDSTKIDSPGERPCRMRAEPSVCLDTEWDMDSVKEERDEPDRDSPSTKREWNSHSVSPKSPNNSAEQTGPSAYATPKPRRNIQPGIDPVKKEIDSSDPDSRTRHNETLTHYVSPKNQPKHSSEESDSSLYAAPKPRRTPRLAIAAVKVENNDCHSGSPTKNRAGRFHSVSPKTSPKTSPEQIASMFHAGPKPHRSPRLATTSVAEESTDSHLDRPTQNREWKTHTVSPQNNPKRSPAQSDSSLYAALKPRRSPRFATALVKDESNDYHHNSPTPRRKLKLLSVSPENSPKHSSKQSYSSLYAAPRRRLSTQSDNDSLREESDDPDQYCPTARREGKFRSITPENSPKSSSEESDTSLYAPPWPRRCHQSATPPAQRPKLVVIDLCTPSPPKRHWNSGSERSVKSESHSSCDYTRRIDNQAVSSQPRSRKRRRDKESPTPSTPDKKEAAWNNDDVVHSSDNIKMSHRSKKVRHNTIMKEEDMPCRQVVEARLARKAMQPHEQSCQYDPNNSQASEASDEDETTGRSTAPQKSLKYEATESESADEGPSLDNHPPWPPFPPDMTESDMEGDKKDTFDSDDDRDNWVYTPRSSNTSPRTCIRPEASRSVTPVEPPCWNTATAPIQLTPESTMQSDEEWDEIEPINTPIKNSKAPHQGIISVVKTDDTESDSDSEKEETEDSDMSEPHDEDTYDTDDSNGEQSDSPNMADNRDKEVDSDADSAGGGGGAPGRSCARDGGNDATEYHSWKAESPGESDQKNSEGVCEPTARMHTQKQRPYIRAPDIPRKHSNGKRMRMHGPGAYEATNSETESIKEESGHGEAGNPSKRRKTSSNYYKPAVTSSAGSHEHRRHERSTSPPTSEYDSEAENARYEVHKPNAASPSILSPPPGTLFENFGAGHGPLPARRPVGGSPGPPARSIFRNSAAGHSVFRGSKSKAGTRQKYTPPASTATYRDPRFITPYRPYHGTPDLTSRPVRRVGESREMAEGDYTPVQRMAMAEAEEEEEDKGGDQNYIRVCELCGEAKNMARFSNGDYGRVMHGEHWYISTKITFAQHVAREEHEHRRTCKERVVQEASVISGGDTYEAWKEGCRFEWEDMLAWDRSHSRARRDNEWVSGNTPCVVKTLAIKAALEKVHQKALLAAEYGSELWPIVIY